MGPANTNLYRMDDVLIRTGRLALLVAIGAAGVAVAFVESETRAGVGRVALGLVGDHPGLVLAAFGLPVVALAVGLRIRRRERRVLQVWQLLRQRAWVDVPELIANSHFTRPELESAVRLLNTRALGHWVWDRSSDTILDGRLHTMHRHVEECDACGGKVSLDVPLIARSAPACPYCGDPVATDDLADRRRDAIEALRAEHAPRKPDAGLGVPFSIPVFLVLLFVCWPLAVGYAWWRYQTGRPGVAAAG